MLSPNTWAAYGKAYWIQAAVLLESRWQLGPEKAYAQEGAHAMLLGTLSDGYGSQWKVLNPESFPTMSDWITVG